MKSVFLSTGTPDIHCFITAWDYHNREPSTQVAFNHVRTPKRGKGYRDGKIIDKIKTIKPRIILFIGANAGPGLVMPGTLKKLRRIAPIIHICLDAGDRTWHPLLRKYADEKCFDLQMSTDGVKSSPVDIVGLAPVDPRPYYGTNGKRDIRCGFSGNLCEGNDESKRWRFLSSLLSRNAIHVRDRTEARDLNEHARFYKRCETILNMSHNGSFTGHHVKVRVTEAPLAGAPILENRKSPIGDWYPDDCYFTYRDAGHAEELILGLGDSDIEKTGRRAYQHTLAHYTPEIIFSKAQRAIGL